MHLVQRILLRLRARRPADKRHRQDSEAETQSPLPILLARFPARNVKRPHLAAPEVKAILARFFAAMLNRFDAVKFRGCSIAGQPPALRRWDTIEPEPNPGAPEFPP
jgi:hypothetical protein